MLHLLYIAVLGICSTVANAKPLYNQDCRLELPVARQYCYTTSSALSTVPSLSLFQNHALISENKTMNDKLEFLTAELKSHNSAAILKPISLLLIALGLFLIWLSDRKKDNNKKE